MERDKLVHQDYLQVLNYYKKMAASGIKYFLLGTMNGCIVGFQLANWIPSGCLNNSYFCI